MKSGLNACLTLAMSSLLVSCYVDGPPPHADGGRRGSSLDRAPQGQPARPTWSQTRNQESIPSSPVASNETSNTPRRNRDKKPSAPNLNDSVASTRDRERGERRKPPIQADSTPSSTPSSSNVRISPTPSTQKPSMSTPSSNKGLASSGDLRGPSSPSGSSTLTPPPTQKPSLSTTTPPSSAPTTPIPGPTPPANTGNLPYGKAVAGKPGIVQSPYTGGEVDVTNLSPGTKVYCPYTDKQFLVP